MVQYGRLADDQGDARRPGGRLQLRRGFSPLKAITGRCLVAAFCFSRASAAQTSFRVDSRSASTSIGLACSAHSTSLRRVRDGLHAVIQVLEPVDELAARQQFLIKHKGERLRHAASLEQGACKLQKNSRKWAEIPRVWGVFCPHSEPRIWSLTVFGQTPNFSLER